MYNVRRKLKDLSEKLCFTWLMLIFSIPLTAFLSSFSTRVATTVHPRNYKGKSSIIKQAANETATAISGCGSTTDVVKCATSVVLQADPNLGNYLWSTSQTSQSITVNSSGIYWWQTVDFSQNLVANGDFTSGNTGFTSDYGYVPPSGSTGNYGPLSAEGRYTVTTNPRNAHTNFASFADHTGNTNGNMMVVNGATTAGAKVWQEVISNLQPNTDYVFSIWFTSVNSGNPGKLKFYINSEALNNNSIVLTSGTPDWKNYSVVWNSGNNTSATIGVTNENTVASGNDFALDDVVFAPVCRKYFNVSLSTTAPAQPSIIFQ